MCFRVKKCCFCIDLSTGCEILVALEIIASASNLVLLFFLHWIVGIISIVGIASALVLFIGVEYRNECCLITYLATLVVKTLLLIGIGILSIYVGSYRYKPNIAFIGIVIVIFMIALPSKMIISYKKCLRFI